MAAASSSLRLATRCRQCRIASKTLGSEGLGRWRMFTTSPSRPAANPDDSKQIAGKIAAIERKLPEVGASESDGVTKPWKSGLFGDFRPSNIASDSTDDLSLLKPTRKRLKPGFFALGKKKGEEFMEDPETEGDVTGMAHEELEQHREFRHYARLIAWEMPLLTKLAKPFEPPNVKQVLRFRYTTYLGEQHPAEKKVVVEFCPEDMPSLTPVQKEKLKKLVGPRYNPETDIIKMSSEMFETQAQNKRYLGDLVDTLLKEARDPTDTFEDIPLDTRHHPIKVKPKFPFEWRMTPARQAELDASRQRATLADEEKARQGALIDGVTSIRNSLKGQAVAALPEMITASKGRGKTLTVRR